jgi:DNA-binding NtrC family response regulator
MMDYHWQGNVRELANAMEYAWIVSGGQPITVAHLPQDVRNPRPATFPASGGREAPVPQAQPGAHPHRPSHETGPVISLPQPAAGGGTKTLSDVEMEYILQVYAKNNHNKQATATELGISLKTLYNKLHKYEEERRLRAG